MSELVNFAERLQWLRTQNGVTLAELAKSTGLGVSYLSRLTSGSRPNASAKTYLALATYFRVDRDWLADGKGVPFPPTAVDQAKADLFQTLAEVDESEAGGSRLKQVLGYVRARVYQFRLCSDAQRERYLQEIGDELARYSLECGHNLPKVRAALGSLCDVEANAETFERIQADKRAASPAPEP